MSKKDVSPSEATVTKGQCGKWYDVLVDRLVKSGLPSGPTQYVLEHYGVEVAEVVVADVTRRVEAHIRATEPHILKRRPLDPATFIGKRWSVAERVGERSGGNLDAGKIAVKDYLKKGESYINGEVRLRRIKTAKDIQLDADDFLALWQEEGHKTLNWLYETKNITWLSFWGTILLDPDGYRFVLYLCRRRGGSWRWDCRWVGYGRWFTVGPAGVLAS